MLYAVNNAERVRVDRVKIPSSVLFLVDFIAVFSEMRTLKFKPHATVTFFAAVNQISGGFR